MSNQPDQEVVALVMLLRGAFVCSGHEETGAFVPCSLCCGPISLDLFEDGPDVRERALLCGPCWAERTFGA